MANAFRIPKGVPPAIRRALRLGKPGQFLDAGKAFRLADALDTLETQILKDVAYPYRNMERARTAATRQKWQREFGKLQELFNTIGKAKAQLTQPPEQAPLPPHAPKTLRPVVQTRVKSPKHIRPGDTAHEWQFGVDYRGKHKKGRASDVMFDARVYDPDGLPITEKQIRQAVDFFASEGELSYPTRRGRHPLAVQTVRWTNWKGQTRRGELSDLQMFRDILMAVGDGGLRVGAVKEDDDADEYGDEDGGE